MLNAIHDNRRLQLLLGLVMGCFFGFFLQKGQVTNYNVIMGQLLLTDFTVVKVIMTAILVGMPGIYLLKRRGLAQLHPKPGSVGSTLVGSLIFGVGFALLGYCPGTAVGAVGAGALDALCGGVLGILAGAALYSAIYPVVKERFADIGSFGEMTLQDLLQSGDAVTVVGVILFILGCFAALESVGL